MSEIRLDLGMLVNTEWRLRQLHEEFTKVEEFDQGLSDAAGDDRLGGALTDFGSAWNLRRESLAAQIQETAQAALAIHDTFVELDQGLANAVASKKG